MQFGHLNFDSLKFLASRRMISGLFGIKNPDQFVIFVFCKSNTGLFFLLVNTSGPKEY